MESEEVNPELKKLVNSDDNEAKEQPTSDLELSEILLTGNQFEIVFKVHSTDVTIYRKSRKQKHRHNRWR